MEQKSIEQLSLSDFEKNPVWQYCNNDNKGELLIKKIKKYPVKSSNGKLFLNKVKFANGIDYFSLICNFDNSNQSLNEHFITLSFYNESKWFHLSRYFDLDYNENGPLSLSKFYGIPVNKIFPIKYDLSKLIEGNKEVLFGEYLLVPKNKLSRSEIINLAVP